MLSLSLLQARLVDLKLPTRLCRSGCGSVAMDRTARKHTPDPNLGTDGLGGRWLLLPSQWWRRASLPDPQHAPILAVESGIVFLVSRAAGG
jgi:hypothetical protein